jgi:hypothetical protein
MLVRYPVLTIVGGAGLTFAIAIGAAVFAYISLQLWPSLQLPEGDRIVRVLLYDDSTNQYEGRVTADYLRWRGTRSTLTDLGAGRAFNHNLTWRDTSMAFGALRSPVDIRSGGSPGSWAARRGRRYSWRHRCIVIGHALWQKVWRRPCRHRTERDPGDTPNGRRRDARRL